MTTPVNHRVISPEGKEAMVSGIDRLATKPNRSLEKVQKVYACALGMDPCDIRTIYSDVSNKTPDANRNSIIKHTNPIQAQETIDFINNRRRSPS